MSVVPQAEKVLLTAGAKFLALEFRSELKLFHLLDLETSVSSPENKYRIYLIELLRR